MLCGRHTHTLMLLDKKDPSPHPVWAPWPPSGEVPNQGAQVAAFGFVPLIHCSLVLHTSIFTFTKATVGVLAFAAQIRCGMEHKRARTGTRFQKWFASECINDQWRSNLFVEISNFHAYKIDVICRFDINQRSRRPSSPNSRARSPPPRAGVSQPSCMPHASTVTRVKYAPCFHQGRGGSLPSPKDKRHHVFATWARQHGLGASSSPVPLPVCVERAKKSK